LGHIEIIFATIQVLTKMFETVISLAALAFLIATVTGFGRCMEAPDLPRLAAATALEILAFAFTAALSLRLPSDDGDVVATSDAFILVISAILVCLAVATGKCLQRQKSGKWWP